MKNIQGIFFKDFKNAYIPDILREIYLEKLYDSYFEGKKDLTVIDAGANIGLFSFYAYPYASKIYAIEPGSEQSELLNFMIRFNKMDDKIVTVKKAISNTNGTTEFYCPANTTMGTIVELGDKVKKSGSILKTEIVQTITMDKLFEELSIDHVDMLKLDIEGSEMDVVQGENFEKVYKKIDTIYGECHVWNNRNPNQLATTLTDYGYKFRWIETKALVFSATRL